jgi:hypothetical protein
LIERRKVFAMDNEKGYEARFKKALTRLRNDFRDKAGKK